MLQLKDMMMKKYTKDIPEDYLEYVKKLYLYYEDILDFEYSYIEKILNYDIDKAFLKNNLIIELFFRNNIALPDYGIYKGVIVKFGGEENLIKNSKKKD